MTPSYTIHHHPLQSMSPEEVAVASSLCRDSFVAFAKEFIGESIPGDVRWGWHMTVICNELQKVAERVFAGLPKDPGNLVINVSPGSSKSTLVSVLFPAWCWTRMPHAQVIGVSYSSILAVELSRKNRDVVRSDKYRAFFPEIAIDDALDQKGHWVLTSKGKRYATGVEGTVTGFHSDLLIIDDPINPQEAVSPADMANANNWLSQTLPSRVTRKGISNTVLIMQRLQLDDPTALFTTKLDKVRWLRIPATTEFPIEPPELADNYIDGLMDPVSLPRSYLDEMRADPGKGGELAYSTQYGQCLVAGTLVSTKRGPVPIEAVTIQDEVWTRSGFRRVLWSGATGSSESLVSVLFANGSTVTGTPKHPVWTENRGWVPLGELNGQDHNMFTAQNNRENALWEDRNYPARKLSCFEVSGICGVPANSISEIARSAATDCIVTCGDSTGATSPWAMSSITKTAIRATIGLEILNASPDANTEEGMRTVAPSVVHFLRKFAFLAFPGVGAQKVENIIGRLVRGKGSSSRNGGKKPPIGIILASCVLGRSSRRSTAPSSIAPTVASIVPASAFSPADTPESVPGVVKTSSHGAFAPDVAPALAVQSFGVEVFDLTIEGASEFYANGILVHNSPHVIGGNKFKVGMLRWGQVPGTFNKLVRAWDKASTAASGRSSKLRGPAYTVGVLMGEDAEGRFWLLDVKRDRLDPFAREKLIHETAHADGAHVVVVVEQEPGGSGMESALKTVERLRGFRCVPVPASGSKESRADDFAVYFNAGWVWVDQRWRSGSLWLGWVGTFVDEAKSWPQSTFLDQIDSASMGFNYLRKAPVYCGPVPRAADIEEPASGGRQVFTSRRFLG